MKTIRAFRAFTLVELIVVITILAILSAVGFTSYTKYLTKVRDSNRISQLESITEGLRSQAIKGQLPIPDENSTIIMEDNINIATQGYAGKNVLTTIGYSSEGLDPKDKRYFSYYLARNRKYFQLMTFLEEKNKDIATLNKFNNTFALDYSQRYPYVKGNKLGILTTKDNVPVQELTGSLDVGNLGNLELKSYLKESEYVVGSGTALITELKKLKEIDKVGGKGWRVEKNHFLHPIYSPKYKYCELMTNDELQELNDFISDCNYYECTDMDTPYNYSKDKWCNITKLYRKYSNFKIPPKEIGYLNKLTYLNIGFNHYENLPIEYKNLDKLTYLRLDGDHKIGNLASIFHENSNEKCQDNIPEAGKRMCIKGNGTTIDITVSDM